MYEGEGEIKFLLETTLGENTSDWVPTLKASSVTHVFKQAGFINAHILFGS